MFPDYTSFLFYHPSMDPNNYSLLCYESQSNIDGRRTAVFPINGRLILFRNALHDPSLQEPFYSKQRHRTQPGCAYYDDETVGNLLLFPIMFIDVDSTTDNIFILCPISRTLSYRKLGYTETRPSSA